MFPAVDPCDTNNGGCHHKCVNYGGRAQCHCEMGYELDQDRRSCRGKLL